MRYVTQKKGFTLIEVLLSVAFIGVLAMMSVPVYQSLQVRNDLDVAAATFAQTIRRAQVLSQASENDAAWGVHIELGAITLYQVGDASYDEVFVVPTSIIPSGDSDVIFSKFDGELSVDTSTILTSTLYEVVIVDVNTKGMVSY